MLVAYGAIPVAVWGAMAAGWRWRQVVHRLSPAIPIELADLATLVSRRGGLRRSVR